MSLQTNVTNGLTALAAAVKSNRVNLGTLSSLTTTAKTDLVSAVNEVKASVTSAGVAINDTTPSGTTTYSSTKINTAISAAVSGLVNGAGAALDTLAELSAALGNDANFATTIATALGLRLRVDVNTQGLTGTQQTNGQTNLGVFSTTQIGDVTHDFVADVTAALA